MARSYFKKLTPEQAWEEYVTMPVDLFISYFLSEGISDMSEMNKLHAFDIPNITGQLYTQDELDHVAGLIETYMNDYINGIGGFEKLEIYMEEELEEIDQEQVDDLMKTLEWFRGCFK